MILWVLFCLHLITSILGESQPIQGYNQRGYEVESPGRRIEENSNSQRQIRKFYNSGSEEDEEEVEDRATPRSGVLDPEVADQLEGNGWLDVIPGTPGKDYPNYEKIPETSFTCNDKTPGGYYADIETRCQVFHVCSTEGLKNSFVCPSGSIFNQKYLVCDWWYDFECDDATDLYSLNEKVNRGGTGSGPSGPGRIEQNVEYSSNDDNFPREELQNNGNFVSADGFDLSLAGTGEGGPGYARNVNNKGYQSNVDNDDEKRKENGNNNDRKIKVAGNKRSENSNRRDEFVPRGFTSSFVNKNREEESGVLFEAQGNGENFRRQNSADVNRGVNYQHGYVDSNSNGDSKTDNFRNGNGGNDRETQSNGFNENNRNPREYYSANVSNQRKDSHKHEESNRNDNFGRKSSSSDYLAYKNPERDYNRGSSSSGFNDKEFSNSDQGRKNNEEAGNEDRQTFNSDKILDPSSGSINKEYRNPFGTRSSNIRGRQRTNGGLQGGLGNGYSSPGRAGELPGSDVIAGSITPTVGRVYDKGDQRSLNSQHRTSSGRKSPEDEEEEEEEEEVTEFRSAIETKKVSVDNQSQQFQNPDFKPRIDSPNNRRHSSKNLHKSFTDPDRQENNKNYANDYLLGLVPGAENQGNGTSGSNQQRRFLPIL